MNARPDVAEEASPEAIEFIRFCYRRRRLGWPELYDEMCHVAARRIYRGWGAGELGERGIGFSLFETPRLAALVEAVVRQERSGEATTDERRALDAGRSGDGRSMRLRTEVLAAG